jgi:hypothetical protein
MRSFSIAGASLITGIYWPGYIGHANYIPGKRIILSGFDGGGLL